MGFFLLSAVMSPLLGLIVVLVMRDEKAAQAVVENRSREQFREGVVREQDHQRDLLSLKVLAGSTGHAPTTTEAGVFPVSVGDELMKLADLRDKGILTEPEFQGQKAALLRRAA